MNYFFHQKKFKCKVRIPIKNDLVTTIFSNENNSEIIELKNNLYSSASTSDKAIISNPSPQIYTKSSEKSAVFSLEKLYKRFRKLSLSLLEELSIILEYDDCVLSYPTKVHYLNVENLLENTFESNNIGNLAKQPKVNTINNSVTYLNNEIPKENQLPKEKFSSNINLSILENKLTAPAIQFVLSSPKSNDWIMDLNLELTFSTFDWSIKKLRSTLKHIDSSTNDEKQKSWIYKPQILYYKQIERESINTKTRVNIDNINDFFKHLISSLSMDNGADKSAGSQVKETISHDGTRCIHYPNGKLAILYIPRIDGSVLFLHDFNEKNDTIAIFSNDSKGIIFQTGNHIMQICIDQDSCRLLNSSYQLDREMKWPRNPNNKLPNSINVNFNSFLSFHCSGKNSIHVKFEFSEKEKPAFFPIHEWLFSNSVFNIENNTLLSNIPYTSNFAVEILKKSSKNLKKEALKSNESEPNYTLDLESLKTKIKEILSNWINYYKRRVKLKDYLINKGRVKSAINDRSKTSNKLFINQKLRRNISASVIKLNDKPISSNIFRLKEKSYSKRPQSAVDKIDKLIITVCPLVIQTDLINRHNEVFPKSQSPDQCLCNKQTITKLTDIELVEFINSVNSSQIIVIGVISTGSSALQVNSKGKFIENSLSNLITDIYFDDLKNSSQKPCIIYNRKSYRLFLYDIGTSGKYLNSTQSLLLRKHQIIPGMCLMFQQGKLMFADYIFNGYGSTKGDLFKQINLCKQLSQNGFYLPSDFQLSFNNESKQWMEEGAYSKIQIFNAPQNVIS